MSADSSAGLNPFVGPAAAADRDNFPSTEHLFDDVQDDTMNLSDADGERTLEWSVDTLSHLHQGPDFSFHNQEPSFSAADAQEWQKKDEQRCDEFFQEAQDVLRSPSPGADGDRPRAHVTPQRARGDEAGAGTPSPGSSPVLRSADQADSAGPDTPRSAPPAAAAAAAAAADVIPTGPGAAASTPPRSRVHWSPSVPGSPVDGVGTPQPSPVTASGGGGAAIGPRFASPLFHTTARSTSRTPEPVLRRGGTPVGLSPIRGPSPVLSPQASPGAGLHLPRAFSPQLFGSPLSPLAPAASSSPAAAQPMAASTPVAGSRAPPLFGLSPLTSTPAPRPLGTPPRAPSPGVAARAAAQTASLRQAMAELAAARQRALAELTVSSAATAADLLRLPRVSVDPGPSLRPAADAPVRDPLLSPLVLPSAPGEGTGGAGVGAAVAPVGSAGLPPDTPPAHGQPAPSARSAPSGAGGDAGGTAGASASGPPTAGTPAAGVGRTPPLAPVAHWMPTASPTALLLAEARRQLARLALTSPLTRLPPSRSTPPAGPSVSSVSSLHSISPLPATVAAPATAAAAATQAGPRQETPLSDSSPAAAAAATAAMVAVAVHPSDTPAAFPRSRSAPPQLRGAQDHPRLSPLGRLGASHWRRLPSPPRLFFPPRPSPSALRWRRPLASLFSVPHVRVGSVLRPRSGLGVGVGTGLGFGRSVGGASRSLFGTRPLASAGSTAVTRLTPMLDVLRMTQRLRREPFAWRAWPRFGGTWTATGLF